MNNTAADLYRCHWCTSLNNAMSADWCLCATAQRTLVCASCKRCFCAAPEAVRKQFWELASADLVARRWQAGKQSSQPAAAEVDSETLPVILVVDDTKVIHTVVDTIFAGVGVKILHAYNGAEGFRMARSIHPEILLTDALLPGLDGRDVVRLLKSDPATADIRAIVMTGLYKGLRHRSEAFREFLCDAYIEKPVGAAHLRAVVAEMLEKSGSTVPEALAS
jgi:CheY-like chemotaxis protein